MKDTQFNVSRYIAEYCSATEELLAEHYLAAFDLQKFQAEFNEPNPQDPMFDCYAITADNVAFLMPYLATAIDWDFETKCYFVETHA